MPKKQCSGASCGLAKDELMIKAESAKERGIFIHPNLANLATLPHHARQGCEVRVTWAYMSETSPEVVCGLCHNHGHEEADARLWMCPMAACGRSAWHDTCLEAMYQTLEARCDLVLAFGCPACGAGWWLRSEMNADGARLREALQELQMQQLLQDMDQVDMLAVPDAQGAQGVQQQFSKQERHLGQLYQLYQLKTQQMQQQQQPQSSAQQYQQQQ